MFEIFKFGTKFCPVFGFMKSSVSTKCICILSPEEHKFTSISQLFLNGKIYNFSHTISNFFRCSKISKNQHLLIGDDIKDTKCFCGVAFYLSILQFPQFGIIPLILPDGKCIHLLFTWDGGLQQGCMKLKRLISEGRPAVPI